MTLTRREALRTGGGLAVASWLAPGCVAPPPAERFLWGVASGDPTTSGVLLWTRLAVERPEEVEVRVYRDPSEGSLVVRELGLADPERDGCVKIDVEGLEPGTPYYYRFHAGSAASALGRTRTLPEAGLARARLALGSCTNFGFAFFHACRRIAERADLTAFVHLGDSIYEYADGEYGALRHLDPPGELLTLSDYRRRYALYRSDPDLREVLRQHPFLVVWDDHEFANNASRDGADAHDPALEGPWSARVAAARRAFFEWQPVRDEARVHRSLALGDLARLLLLDTRMDDRDPRPADEAERQRPDRRILGAAQEDWLLRALTQADVAYTVLGSQVVLAPVPVLANLDAWDGFAAQQARVLAAIASAPRPVVVASGDQHASFAFDLPGPGYDAGSQEGAIGAEWAAPALASPPLYEDPREAERVLLEGTPHLRWTEQSSQGYVLLDLDRTRARAEWWLVEDATRADGGAERLAKAFETRAADRASREVAAEPSPPIADAPALAP